MAIPSDMHYWLARKYSVMQQGADATSQNAASGALTSAASAAVDNTRARLMPGESMANILAQRAQARLANEQASVVAPVAQAGIANTNAQTAYTGTQNQALFKSAVELQPEIGVSSLRRAMGVGGGGGAGSIFSGSSEARPPRQLGETVSQYMDRTGWGS